MIILQGNKIERSFSGDVLFDNINIQVDERDRIALVGRNGAGKSTLLKILVGEEAPTSGEINTKRDLNLSYLAQDSRFESSNTIYEEMLNVFSDLRADEKRLRDMEMKMAELTGEDLNKLMIDYDRLSEDFRQRGGFTYESDIRAILNGFKFDESMWGMPISDLSGGQNTRLALAKMLLEKPELLVLDEPTNDLDISTLTILEDYLDHFQGIVITVSHDRYFLDRVVRRIFAFEGGGAIRQYEGGYTDYQAACGERIAAEMEASGTASGQERGRGQKTGGASGAGTSDAAETAKDKNRGRQREKKLKFSYMEQKEWETIEDDIAALEEAIADLEQQMQDSARDYTALNGIIKEKEEKEALLEEKMDRWMYLNDLAEKIEAQAAAHK